MVAAVIDIVGILSNVLIIVTMRSPAFVKTPHVMINVSLAVTDLAGLLTVFTTKVLFFVYQTYPWEISGFLCKGVQWIFASVSQMDIAIILLLCVERTVVIPPWQFWDSGGVKLESLCKFSIVGCQWTVNCLLGNVTFES